MLGRTDSRPRLLILLTIFAIGSMALFARTAYWQVLNGDFLMARGIAPSVAERIRMAMRDERVEHVALEAEPERVYPQAGGGPESKLAAHLLGFVNRENTGQYGVEQAYQD